MADNTKLSIITINYNDAAGLRKTIESVITQTSKDFEYIVIDGGSTDGSLGVIKAFESRIDHWVSEPDKGIYHAMNKGIRQAKGEYCQFLNSGDMLAGPEVTRLMIDQLKKHENCPILYGNMIKEIKPGKFSRDRRRKSESLTMLNFYRGTINHSPAYISKALFDQYGPYDESLKIVSDWKWFLQVIGLHGVKAVHTAMDVTVFDMSGISNTNRELEKTERRKVLEELLPVNILADYDRYRNDIDRMQRLKRWPMVKQFVFLVERGLFKLEKTLKSR